MVRFHFRKTAVAAGPRESSLIDLEIRTILIWSILTHKEETLSFLMFCPLQPSFLCLWLEYHVTNAQALLMVASGPASLPFSLWPRAQHHPLSAEMDAGINKRVVTTLWFDLGIY